MEIALHKFQDIFDSIGHEVRPYEMQILKASIAYLHYLMCISWYKSCLQDCSS